ncbi:MAG: PCRF domain-containing protein, partial [Dehalococcoidia bacterium]
MWDRLDAIERRYDELTEEMASPEVSQDYERMQELNKERSTLEEIVVLYRYHKALSAELE